MKKQIENAIVEINAAARLSYLPRDAVYEPLNTEFRCDCGEEVDRKPRVPMHCDKCGLVGPFSPRS